MYIVLPAVQLQEWFRNGQERNVAFNMLRAVHDLGGPVIKTEEAGEDGPRYESQPGLQYFTDEYGDCHIKWEDLTPLQKAANAARNIRDIRLN